MNYIVNIITNRLIKVGILEEEERELYEYASFILLFNLFPLILTMVIGLCMGRFKESIVFILPFLCVRKFSGGFHAKNARTCIIASSIISVFCIYIIGEISIDVTLAVTVVIAVISLILFSPIDNENRRLESHEVIRYGRITRRIVLAFFGIYLLLICAGIEKYAICIAVGIILSAALQIPCIVIRFFNKYHSY